MEASRAADVVAKSSADGYTFLLGHVNSNAIAPYMLAKIPYDPVADFAPIARVATCPCERGRRKP